MKYVENLEKMEEEIEVLKDKINSFELDPDDFENLYDEMLDESYPDFMGSYSTSYTLQQVDPTAYRCGLLDYVYNLDLTESSEYNELVKSLEELEDELSDAVADALSELQEELDGYDLETEDEDELVEIEATREEIKYIEENY